MKHGHYFLLITMVACSLDLQGVKQRPNIFKKNHKIKKPVIDQNIPAIILLQPGDWVINKGALVSKPNSTFEAARVLADLSNHR